MSNWRKWLLGGLVVWALGVAWWAVTPMSDTVPTRTVSIKGVPTPTTQTVECASPLSGSSNPTEPLPVLKPDTRAYERDPCKSQHQNARLILVIDVVLVVGVLIVLLKTWKPAEQPAVDLTSAA